MENNNTQQTANANYSQNGTNQQQYQPQYQQPSTQPRMINPCPKCGSEMQQKYRVWQILISIIFFPIGLISLAAGKGLKCPNCGYKN